ncbi:MAG: hypothetical protein CM1200mP9_06620 [Gammaproteobacteria bacterium]|nr:MAG: hypothetical protein CM1200mP9_06620 [Gammaproteobacteria bacterium]
MGIQSRGDLRPTVDRFGGLSFVLWNLAAYTWTRGELEGTGMSIRWSMFQWLTAQDIAMGLKRVFDILDMEPDVTDKPNAVKFENLESEISFQDVRFFLRAVATCTRRCVVHGTRAFDYRDCGAHRLWEKHAHGTFVASLRPKMADRSGSTGSI